MANLYSQFTYDDDLNLRASASLTSSADGTIIDVGAGIVDGFLVIDLVSAEVASGNEIYTISLEGSNVAAMTSGSVCLAKKVFGNLVVPMDAALSAAGRYVVPFRNEEGGTTFRYIRLSNAVAGSIDSTGIVFGAFVAKR
ncbi:MAG: hypothetical protein WC322_02675 [Candidatus Paceibacterota bacterium]|jgi:hypothetical protein